MSGDPRLTPARGDVAAAHLRGKVKAGRFAEPVHCVLRQERAALRPRPEETAPLDTVLLYGEPFDVYDRAGAWAWGQSGLDGYVGYVPADGLATAPEAAPTHCVQTLFCQLYGEPKLKTPPVGVLPFAARVRVVETRDGYARIASGFWMPATLLRPIDEPVSDWVAVAERFLAVPYVWGGRSSSGIDCSGLVQLALQATGLDCPRDSDMQEAALGETLAPDAALRRGDLIFWRGHVGVMQDAVTLLHANAHHMAVAREPLAVAIARISASGDGEVTRRARLDAGLSKE